MRRLPNQLPPLTFGAGLSASLRGIGYTLKTPSLLFLVLLALAINGTLLGVLLWWGWSWFDPLFAWLQQAGTGTGGWSWLARQLVGLGVWLKVLVSILVLYFIIPTIFPILLNLNPLTAILLTKMFEVTFRHRTGRPLPQFFPLIKGLLLSLWAECRKLFSLLLLFVLALFLSLIPLVGTILAPALFLAIGAQFAGWSYITPYYEALGYTYPLQREAMRRQRMAIWGLGSMAMIPGLNLIALFTGPVGGAIFAAEHHVE